MGAQGSAESLAVAYVKSVSSPQQRLVLIVLADNWPNGRPDWDRVGEITLLPNARNIANDLRRRGILDDFFRVILPRETRIPAGF